MRRAVQILIAQRHQLLGYDFTYYLRALLRYHTNLRKNAFFSGSPTCGLRDEGSISQ